MIFAALGRALAAALLGARKVLSESFAHWPMLGSAMLVSVAALVLAGGASAYPGPLPAGFDPANATTAPSGGQAIGSVLDGGGAIPNNVIQGPWKRPYTQLITEAEVVPEAMTIPGLQVVVLGADAFLIGVKIGSTLNSKWLHLEGVGLGTTSGMVNMGAVTPTAHYARTIPGFSTQEPAGWYFKANASGSTYDSWALGTPDPNYCDPAGGWTCAQQAASYSAGQKAAWTAANHWLTTANAVKLRLVETACNHAQFCEDYYAFYVPEGSAFLADQGLQAYINQTYGTSSGWVNPATGAGVTSNAPGFGSGPSNPAHCYMVASVLYCNGIPAGNGPGIAFPRSFPASGQPGDDDPDANELNCLVDPVHYCVPPVVRRRNRVGNAWWEH